MEFIYSLLHGVTYRDLAMFLAQMAVIFASSFFIVYGFMAVRDFVKRQLAARWARKAAELERGSLIEDVVDDQSKRIAEMERYFNQRMGQISNQQGEQEAAISEFRKFKTIYEKWQKDVSNWTQDWSNTTRASLDAKVDKLSDDDQFLKDAELSNKITNIVRFTLRRERGKAKAKVKGTNNQALAVEPAVLPVDDEAEARFEKLLAKQKADRAPFLTPEEPKFESGCGGCSGCPTPCGADEDKVEWGDDDIIDWGKLEEPIPAINFDAKGRRKASRKTEGRGGGRRDASRGKKAKR